jgi:5,10-methylene-tetrahydrofolate dehydrogenase/methenyl tetrahydrofolate cyclohydrolase
MPAQLIDGKAIAAVVRQEVADEVNALREKTGTDAYPGRRAGG